MVAQQQRTKPRAEVQAVRTADAVRADILEKSEAFCIELEKMRQRHAREIELLWRRDYAPTLEELTDELNALLSPPPEPPRQWWRIPAGWKHQEDMD